MHGRSLIAIVGYGRMGFAVNVRFVMAWCCVPMIPTRLGGQGSSLS